MTSVIMVFVLTRNCGQFPNDLVKFVTGLRRRCGLSLSICFSIQLAFVTSFSRVYAVAFSLVLSLVLNICFTVDISVCNSFDLFYFPS